MATKKLQILGSLGGSESGCTCAKNLLDNSDFTNPVDQREAADVGSSAEWDWEYAIDRWKFFGSGFVINSSGITIPAGGGMTQLLPLERVSSIDGYTAVVCLSDGTISTSIAYLESGIVGDPKRFTIKNEAENTITVVWAALYKGEYTADTMPPYIAKGYAAELAECQRYYLLMSGSDNSIRGVGAVGSSNQITVTFYLPNEMRVRPTLEAYKSTLVRGNGKSVTATPSETTLTTMCGNQIVISVKFSNSELSDMVGHIAMAYSNKLALSADL